MGIENHPQWKKINGFVKNMIGLIEKAQERHFANHKRYFQGLKNPVLTCDGTDEKAIAYGLKPVDKPTSYADLDNRVFNSDAKFPINVEITDFEGPTGHGYNIMFSLEYAGIGPDRYGHDGSIWNYRHYVGPVSGAAGLLDEWYIVNLS